MTLLFMLGGASTGTVSVTPIAHGNVCSVLVPDEVAIGVATTIYMEVADSTGPTALDSAPQYVVYGWNSSGTRSEVRALAYMTQVGASNLWSGTWTPSAAGVYEVKVVGLVSATAFFATAPITVRSKFDPIALAVDDVLASRMGVETVITQ